MLESVAINALHAAMRGLHERQSAITDDIANVNTPFFRARSVQFEGSLKQALAAGDDPLTATPSVQVSNAPAGLNGNNVDLTAESVSSVDTQLAYQLALRAAGDRFTLVRTAIKGA